MTLQKKKNLLKAAKKALIKQDKTHKKLLKIIDSALKGDHSHRAFNDFIKNVVKESKCGSNVKKLQKYISQVISRDDNSTYSILNPSEVRLFAVEILWNNRKSRKLTM